MGVRFNHRRGASAIDLVVMIVFIAVVATAGVLIVLASRAMVRDGRGAAPTFCASNLKQIGLGMMVYTIENGHQFPQHPFAEARERESGAVTYAPGRIGSHRDRYSTESDTELSTTRSLWMLWTNAYVDSPGVFVCPGTEDVAPQKGEEERYFDFASYENVSYGYQVPFGKAGKPDTNVKRAGEIPFSSDQGPYGASLEAGLPHPGPPKAPASGGSDDWRLWNSPNHEGLLTNVAYIDGHVEGAKIPLAGIHHDNIYTQWENVDARSGHASLERIHGVPPTNNETPLAETDALIYP